MIICTIIGVRPQFVKAAVLSPIIRKEHKEVLIHTGQHYDANMSSVFFRELDLPEPDYILVPSGRTDKVKVDCMVRELEPIIQREKADAILIYGDTNSTLAGALVASELKIPAIHVEAGERNGLKNNPEEQIRMRVDRLSSLLLCSTEQALEKLRREGLGDKAHFIGNLMEISFEKNIVKPWQPHLISLFNQKELSIPKAFYLLTCHRQENSNDKCLTEILLAMEKAKFPVIYPVHPRNKERVLRILAEQQLKNILVTEPTGYFDSIHLIKNAVTVVTDSGGVLQEAHYVKTPYVFVLDIDKVPANTRFDVSRLAKPEHEAILHKLNEEQVFDRQDMLMSEEDGAKLARFEEQVLRILSDFEKECSL